MQKSSSNYPQSGGSLHAEAQKKAAPAAGISAQFDPHRRDLSLDAELQKVLQIKANRDLAKRTVASFTIAIIYVIFVLMTPTFHEHPKVVYAFGLLLILSLIFRVLIAKSALASEKVLSSSDWLRKYALATLLMGLVWALFAGAIFILYKTEWVFLLLTLSTAGIAAAATSSLAPNAWLARAYVALLIAPIAAMGLIGQTRASVTLAVLLCIFIAALMLMVRDNNLQFLTSLSTIEKLNLQKSDLENIIGEIGKNSVELKDASINLSSISSLMSKGAEAMSSESRHVAEAAVDFNINSKNIALSMQHVTEKADQVAHAIDGMTAKINTISQTTQNTKSIANEAVRQAQSATTKVSELGNSAQEVGKITEAIKEISEQTNLLALNATIEAARAGEAGKGFSVVANEIKDLATQTADATLKIKKQIETIQRVISETVSEIGRISEITTQIDTSISASADSVAEQSITTKTIAESVTASSREISDINRQVVDGSETADSISKGITEVSEAANEVAVNSSQVDTNSETLMRLANALNDIVSSTQSV